MQEDIYSGLRPLIKRGEDRDAVLTNIIEQWSTPSRARGNGREAIIEHVDAGGLVIREVALVDGNTGESIDLGGLLSIVEERLRANGEPEEFRSRPDLFILLYRCRIDTCMGFDQLVRPRLICVQSMFSKRASFSGWTFGDGVTFNGCRFCDGALFQRATLGDRAEFRASILIDADFRETTFGDDASFLASTLGPKSCFQKAVFGRRARFTAAKVGDQSSFRWASFAQDARLDWSEMGEGVDFVAARFGDHVNVEGARFLKDSDWRDATFAKGATFKQAQLPEADLRTVRGFLPDETETRGAQFSARATDPWSRLRSAYTGPRLVFNLLFLILFFVPLVARAVGWGMLGKAEQRVADVAPTLSEHAARLRPDHPAIAGWAKENLDTIERRLPGGDDSDWRTVSVGRAVLGVDRGVWTWLPAVLILIYNVGKGGLTYVVAPMRDAEERSGITPALQAPTFGSVRRQLSRERKVSGISAPGTLRGRVWRRVCAESIALWRWRGGYLESYGWLIWPHRVLAVLFWVAVLSFIVNAVIWLSTPVWIPKQKAPEADSPTIDQTAFVPTDRWLGSPETPLSITESPLDAPARPLGWLEAPLSPMVIAFGSAGLSLGPYEVAWLPTGAALNSFDGASGQSRGGAGWIGGFVRGASRETGLVLPRWQ